MTGTTGQADPLRIDAAAEVARIVAALRHQVAEVLRRRGAVVAVSGGIDSAVCAALAVRAFGPKRTLLLALPERDGSGESTTLARELADTLGAPFEVQPITGILEAAGCYQRRDDAIRRVVPEYGAGWRSKIVLPPGRLESDRLNVHHLVVASPDGHTRSLRLPAAEYLEIVAATNFKQRVRTMMAYAEADRRHAAVVGTPNRLEYDQGFFVKGGDGLADVKPIAHLYKTQVYQLAEYLAVPEGIRRRPPTTDTYSLPQSQEEFYFLLPALQMDQLLEAQTRGESAADAATRLGLEVTAVERAYAEFEQKRRTTRALHAPAQLVEPVFRDHALDGSR